MCTFIHGERVPGEWRAPRPKIGPAQSAGQVRLRPTSDPDVPFNQDSCTIMAPNHDIGALNNISDPNHHSIRLHRDSEDSLDHGEDLLTTTIDPVDRGEDWAVTIVNSLDYGEGLPIDMPTTTVDPVVHEEDLPVTIADFLDHGEGLPIDTVDPEHHIVSLHHDSDDSLDHGECLPIAITDHELIIDSDCIGLESDPPITPKHCHPGSIALVTPESAEELIPNDHCSIELVSSTHSNAEDELASLLPHERNMILPAEPTMMSMTTLTYGFI